MEFWHTFLRMFHSGSFEDCLCVCKRFKDVIDSAGEIWRTFNTDDQLTVHQFGLIIVKHACHLNHVSLRFSQKCVRYNSPDLYIESALYLDLS